MCVLMCVRESVFAYLCGYVYLKDGEYSDENRGNCSDAGNTQPFKLDTSHFESSIHSHKHSHSIQHSMERMHVVVLTFCYFNTHLYE